ncbi:hepatic lectin-like [Limanda limanda]|uniref:hepatic lectin-like n=1 Tax=Limanda limanda TaxID=27771 RepID=UPI0029C73FF1|nr:hepatic lectin-like [Limanda limanda]
MDEAEVLYSDIKFKRARGNTDVATPSTDEPTYSEVKISKAQRPAELPASSRRSGVTSERVALLVLSVLLAAALTALGVTLHENTQTKKLQEECEAKHLTDETCPRCEDGWEPHGGKCYFFSSVTSSWTQSRTQCTSMRGDLVVINNREEQRFLESRVRGKMENDEDKFWIGLTDAQKEGEWLWVDNTSLDTSLMFWREGQPDNWYKENPDGENCVRMGEKDGATYLKSWLSDWEESSEHGRLNPSPPVDDATSDWLSRCSIN